MPITGTPFRTDFTDLTPMGPAIHAVIHNAINQALNEISDLIDVFLEAPPGSVTTEQLTDAIAAAVSGITSETHGWIPDTETVLTLVDEVFTIPTRATHPSPPAADHINIYGLDDESAWVQTSTDARTQLGPPWLSPKVVLATSAAVSSAASYSNILTAEVVNNAAYEVGIFGAYTADTAASTGRLLTAFSVPAGAGGTWTPRMIQAAYTGSTGSTTMTQLAKTWAETAASAGAGPTTPVPFEVTGRLITGATAGDFVWKAKLQEAGPTVTIYGMDVPGFLGAIMTLARIG